MVRRDTVCCDALNFGFFFLARFTSWFGPYFLAFFLFFVDGIRANIPAHLLCLWIFCQIADQRLCKRNMLKVYFDTYQLELGSAIKKSIHNSVFIHFFLPQIWSLINRLNRVLFFFLKCWRECFLASVDVWFNYYSCQFYQMEKNWYLNIRFRKAIKP